MKWDEFPDWAQEKILEIFSELRSYDEETFLHCMRVGRDARFLAEAAGLNVHQQQQMEWAGMLHDVGKSMIPRSVLFKPGKLTESEYNLVQLHSVYSAQMMEPLCALEFFGEIHAVVLHHHERLDGRGYPAALLGEKVPRGSRIILIADTFDAMTHRRSYRQGLPVEVAFAELKKFSGTQFDGELVAVYLESKPHFAEKLVPLEQEPVQARTARHHRKKAA